MPFCKECGSRISKFDRDICPICGCKHPLENVKSETVEITSQLDLQNEQFANYKPSKRKTLILLMVLLGFTGAPFFYLGYIKRGLAALGIYLFIIGVFGSLLAFLTPLPIPVGYIIALLITYVLNIILAVATYKNHSLTNARGDLLE